MVGRQPAGRVRGACAGRASGRVEMALHHGYTLCRLARMPRTTWQTQAILAALLEDPGKPHYGLELGRAAGLASGTIYPILARLEREGWVSSEVEDIDPKVVGRRPRRYYMLTQKGASLGSSEIDETRERLRLAPSPRQESGRLGRRAADGEVRQ
jgi:PadR family transcriptional regulator PadR